MVGFVRDILFCLSSFDAFGVPDFTSSWLPVSLSSVYWVMILGYTISFFLPLGFSYIIMRVC